MMVFFVAFIGQSWNIAGGFAGQTSFGHVVFFGTGAYTSTILQVTYGWNPWLAWPAAMLAGGIVGWVIAFLSFRAGLRGSYFALITLGFRRGLPHPRQLGALHPRRARHADQGRPAADQLPVQGPDLDLLHRARALRGLAG